MAARTFPEGRPGAVTLPDGRRMTFESYGATVGRVVLVLDGSGSRAQARVAGAVASELGGIRIVAPNRPGFHGSTPVAERTIASTGRDLLRFLDALDVEEADVFAQSAGTPFAIALAAAAPDRVGRQALLGPVSPPVDHYAWRAMSTATRMGFQTARLSPALLRVVYRSMRRTARRDPERVAHRLMRMRPVADREVMTRPDIWPLIVASVPDLTSAPDAAAHELSLIARPWDVDPSTANVPTSLWTAEDDDVHPPEMADELLALLPDAELHRRPGAIFSWLDDYDEILLDVTGKHG